LGSCGVRLRSEKVRWSDLGGDRDRKSDGVSTSVMTQLSARTEVRVGGLRSSKPHPPLRIPGLPTTTLYRHILDRRRILIYTLLPVEASYIMSQVAADI
jgi:hypothetical protein